MARVVLNAQSACKRRGVLRTSRATLEMAAGIVKAGGARCPQRAMGSKGMMKRLGDKAHNLGKLTDWWRALSPTRSKGGENRVETNLLHLNVVA